MITYNTYIKCILILLFIGCKDLKKEQGDTPELKRSVQLEKETATAIVAQAIHAHGGKRYDTAHYQFVFRDKTYRFNNQNGYIYTVIGTDSIGNTVTDSLRNGTFTRKVNGLELELSGKDVAKYSNALNSVIYFATLPHKLKDAAVQKEYLGKTGIKNEEYDIIQVTFATDGGGKDYDDVFMYWINRKSHYIDYLAYRYSTNNGGVRFRSAYNPRTIDGIRFQDYVNWEAPVGTPLEQLPVLFEKGQLKELSKIKTEDIQNVDLSDPEV